MGITAVVFYLNTVNTAITPETTNLTYALTLCVSVCVCVSVYYVHIFVPVAQWLEHCVSSAKVVGSIPREHILTKKCIA